MLQTATSSEDLPLFSSTSSSPLLPMMAMSPISSSCATEARLVIQRPPSDMSSYSFDWSDFPVIQQEDVYGGYFPTAPAAPSTSSSSSMFASSSRNSSFDSGCASTCSSTSSSSDEMEEETRTTRKVSFASTIQVRTHTIVLGDHPCCDSLPLELGWEYNDEVSTSSALSNNNNNTAYYNSPSQTRRRRSAARRRSYLERKDILKRISGMTDDEIKQIVGGGKVLHHSSSTRSLSSLMIGDV